MRIRLISFIKNSFVLFYLILFLATGAFALNSKDIIHFNFSHTPLKEVLDCLINQYEIPIVYQDKQVKDIIVSTNKDNCSVEETLNLILQNTSLTWLKLGAQIVITNKNPISSSNNLHVNGHVVDVIDEKGLPYANIQLKGTGRGTASDESGLFQIADVPVDPCTLQVT